jgi:hypothetical protein
MVGPDVHLVFNSLINNYLVSLFVTNKITHSHDVPPYETSLQEKLG